MIVSPAHTFGTDAMLLADFASPRRKDIACDFGTGCGIIPFLWCRDGLCKSVAAVELQDRGFDQLCRSVRMNGLSEKFTAVHADLRELKGKLPLGAFDLVTMNPPYKRMGGGILSEADFEQIARHEMFCTADDIASAAHSLLRFGGRLCMCTRPERLFDTMLAMHQNKIEPKKLRPVMNKANTPPWLVLIEGRNGGKSGMTVLPPLYLREADDGYTEEMLRILEPYREEEKL